MGKARQEAMSPRNQTATETLHREERDMTQMTYYAVMIDETRFKFLTSVEATSYSDARYQLQERFPECSISEIKDPTTTILSHSHATLTENDAYGNLIEGWIDKDEAKRNAKLVGGIVLEYDFREGWMELSETSNPILYGICSKDGEKMLGNDGIWNYAF